MKVTITSSMPTEAQIEHGVVSMTPEMTCAVAARYSRNDEGIDAILEKVAGLDQNKAVDSIFNMVDYGHASIADMADLPIFIDGISIWLAYYLWSLSPTASGQETSTRYVKFDAENIVSPEDAGIKPEQHETWRIFIEESAKRYTEMTAYWELVLQEYPELLRIPAHITSDKVIERFKRNFVFDRARYYIPVAAKTNLMMRMTARDWVTLTRHLGSHYIPEARSLAAQLKAQLQHVVPRLMKHAEPNEDCVAGIADELLDDMLAATKVTWVVEPEIGLHITSSTAVSEIKATKHAFARHWNRYAFIGREASRITATYSINGLAMAELRDLNRHRPGTKYCPMVPVGFYGAMDQVVASPASLSPKSCYEWGAAQTIFHIQHVASGNSSHPYWGLLGTQYYYERTVSLNRLAYEIELRTGTGAHYRYCQHMLDVHEELIKQLPHLAGLLNIGTGEPE